MALPPACTLARIAGTALLALCMASAARGQDSDPLKLSDTQLEPLSWAALDGWSADDHVASFSAFLKSCIDAPPEAVSANRIPPPDKP